MAFEESSRCVLNGIQPAAEIPEGNESVTSLERPVDEARALEHNRAIDDEIYAWIGCNCAKFGNLYAAAATRPNNMVSVTSILGGAADNTGSSIARRLVLKTGLNIVLACNIPKNSPMLEADAERKLVQKLRSLGYIKPITERSSCAS